MKFLTTNNEVEYKGILTGLRLGKAFGVKNFEIGDWTNQGKVQSKGRKNAEVPQAD